MTDLPQADAPGAGVRRSAAGWRSRTVAVLLCAAGGALVLTAGSRPWLHVRVRSSPGLPAFAHTVSGSDRSDVLRALALLSLAAAAALFATRGWSRRLVGVVLTAAGAGLVAATLAGATGTPGAKSLGLTGSLTVTSRTAWPWPCLLGSLLVLAGGLLTVRFAGAWTTLSRKYDAPSAQRAQARPAGRDLWDALDRGDDPTDRPEPSA